MQMLKRTLSIVLTVVMLVSMFSMVTFASAAWDGTVAIAFDGGSGTEADPYIIVNAEQLALMSTNIKAGTDAGAYYKLGADITLNEGVLDADYNLNSGSFTGWTSGGEFTGVFDGDGHTIYGFYSTQQNGGLFSTVKGTIKNLKMKDAAYKSTWTVFGILASKVSTATIENVEVDGAIIGNQTGNTNSSRGIMVGKGSANFIGCIVRGKVVSTNVAPAQRCGGFIGVADSTTNFTNCVNYADLGDLSQVGGFVGLSTGAVNFTDCINYGDITSSTAYASWLGPSAEEHSSAAGGFIGVVYKGHPNFTRCANEGTISGDSYAGGLIGVALNYYHNITLNNIYNIGAISVMGTNGLEYADDFIGHIYNGVAKETSVEAGDLAAYQAGAWLGDGADLWSVKAGANPTLKLVSGEEGGEEPEAPHVHTEKTTTVDATCTADGSITVTCETCGETISTEVIAAKGHTEKTTTVDSTCTADGKTTVKCDVCGTVISETVIPATGHTYVDGKCECGDVDAATVAQVGDKYFYSFADAYAAAEAGDTITLLADITANAIITIDKAITLDGNGKTLTSTAGRAINVECTGDVTIEDLTIVAKGERAINIINQPANVTVNNVTATAKNYAVNLATSAGAANVTINDSDLTGLAVVNVASAGAYVEINDTKLTNVDANPNENYGAITVYHAAENATVNVNGGEIIVADDSRKAYVFADSATVNGIDDVGMIAARIGDAGYETLEEALADAKDGDTITVIQTAVIDEDMTIANVSIVAGSKADPAIRIVNDATVTFENVTIDAAEYCVTLGASDFSSAGNLIIKSGTYHGNITAISVTKGNLVIEGGNFSADPYNGNYAYLINCIDSSYKNGTATVTISGGNFENWNPQDNAAEGAGSDFCADGFDGVDNGDGTFSVVLHVHTEKTTTVDATCTADGSVTVTCDVCKETLSTEVIPALGHNYVDGTCGNCGEADPNAPQGPTYVESLAVFGCSVIFESDYSIRVYVLNDTVAPYSSVKLVASKAIYDETGFVRYEEIELTNPTVKSSYHLYDYTGFAAKEIASEIKLHLVATDAEGNEFYGPEKPYSLKEYALNQIKKSGEDAKFRTMLVDFLNYGAAAQVHFKYNVNALANVGAEDYQDCATPTREYTSVKGGLEDASYATQIRGVSLVFENKVNIRGYVLIKDQDINDIKANWYGEATYVDAKGETKTQRIDLSTMTSSSVFYVFSFNNLYSKEMSIPVNFILYNADGEQMSNTVTYSIESYASSMVSEGDEFAKLCETLMKFGDSAKAYLTK